MEIDVVVTCNYHWIIRYVVFNSHPHKHTHTYTHTHTFTYTHTHTHTHIHTHTHTHIHTYIHTHSHTHTYIHSHTHTLPCTGEYCIARLSNEKCYRCIINGINGDTSEFLPISATVNVSSIDQGFTEDVALSSIFLALPEHGLPYFHSMYIWSNILEEKYH